MRRLHYLAVQTLALSCVSMPFIAQATDIDPINNDMEVVLTPARLRQSLADAPASVTVITADMIQKFGIRTIPDALRLVPGMAVDQLGGNDFRINYHGTNNFSPRRMNVLIDGVSVYLPAQARVDWAALPISIEDVHRIEVTRGPNSATYGANSMLATINIITKLPEESAGTTLIGTVGSLGTESRSFRYGGRWNDSTTFRVALDDYRDDGFGNPQYINPDHDGTRIKRLNIRTLTKLNANETLDMQGWFLQALKEVGRISTSYLTDRDADQQQYNLSATWKKSFSSDHELKFQAYFSRNEVRSQYRACAPTFMLLPELYRLWQANPSYVTALLNGQIPTGGTAQDDSLAVAAVNAALALGSRMTAPTCGDLNENYTEERRDIEIQDTYVFSEKLRVVTALGARQDVGISETLFGGQVGNNSVRAFANVEYKPVLWLNMNAGGFFEDDQLTGPTFSPRLAFNAHASPNHSFRFVVSKGTRSPDLFEQRGNVSYLFRNLDQPLNGASEAYLYQTSKYSGDLQHEKIFSKEIGYHGNFPTYGLLLDAKIFDDRLTSLISDIHQAQDFTPANRDSLRLRGVELQMNLEPTPKWMAYFTYSYLLNTDATTPLEQTQYSKNSGVAGIAYLFDSAVRGSLAVYGAREMLSGNFVTRKDFTFSKTFDAANQSRLTTALTVSLRNDVPDSFSPLVNSVRTGRHDPRTQYYFTVKLEF